MIKKGSEAKEDENHSISEMLLKKAKEMIWRKMGTFEMFWMPIFSKSFNRLALDSLSTSSARSVGWLIEAFTTDKLVAYDKELILSKKIFAPRAIEMFWMKTSVES